MSGFQFQCFSLLKRSAFFFLSAYFRLVALFLISFSVWLQSFSFCFLFLWFRIPCVNLRFSFIRGILFQNLHVATALSSIRCSFRVSLCLPRNRMKKEGDQERPQNIQHTWLAVYPTVSFYSIVLRNPPIPLLDLICARPGTTSFIVQDSKMHSLSWPISFVRSPRDTLL